MFRFINDKLLSEVRTCVIVVQITIFPLILTLFLGHDLDVGQGDHDDINPNGGQVDYNDCNLAQGGAFDPTDHVPGFVDATLAPSYKWKGQARSCATCACLMPLMRPWSHFTSTVAHCHLTCAHSMP